MVKRRVVSLARQSRETSNIAQLFHNFSVDGYGYGMAQCLHMSLMWTGAIKSLTLLTIVGVACDREVLGASEVTRVQITS